MFNSFTGMAKLLKNSTSLSQRMKESKERLRSERVSGYSSCRQVVVEMNGLGEVKGVSISETLIASGDKSQMQLLVADAVSGAVSAARRLHVEAIRELTGGIELPGMSELLQDL